VAGGAVNTFRQLGMTLASAVFGAVFTSRTAAVLAGPGTVPDADRAASALAGGQAQRLIQSAPPAHRDAARHLVHQAFAAGLDRVFLLSATAAALGGLIVLILVRPQPRTATAHGDGAPAVPAPDRSQSPATADPGGYTA
jgi:hypothetical protein